MTRRIFIAGAAGLVGQNLIARMRERTDWDIVAVDKAEFNLGVLAGLHPGVATILADLSRPGGWEERLRGCDALVMLQAQIGGLNHAEFVANNITSTERLLAAARAADLPYIVHVSSSVVNSLAVDYYTETKKAQEQLVDACPVPHVVLRPTLMFGWFDRKHLGWLRRFMDKSPVFPVPGTGRYIRQPLYGGDFSEIIMSCLQSGICGTYDISGQEKIDYIDLIRAIRDLVRARARIVKIPYWAFWSLLKAYSIVDRNPPFTTKQLKALATPEIFPVIDWPAIFSVPATPLRQALSEAYNHPRYSDVVLKF